MGARHHVSHLRAREREDVPAGLPLRRASDVDAVQLGRCPVVVLSELDEHLRSEERNLSIVRLIAKLPTLAAFAYRHVKGLPFVYPDNDLSYSENFLSMVARMSESKYEANPVFARAIEMLFILHADHEQNCSTNAVRAGRLVARRSVLGGGGRHRGALRAAARRRQRAGAADARGDRESEERPGVHRGGEEREGPDA